MSTDRRVLIWITGFIVLGILVHLLSDVLLPFVAGMAVAYFLDPLADRLEARGLSRTWATTAITALFFLAVLIMLIVLYPLLQTQVVALIRLLPQVVEMIRSHAEPFLAQLQAGLAEKDLTELREAAGQYAGKILKWVTGLLSKAWSGGVAFLNLLSLLVITPVVAFYLLRDWDRIVALVDDHLPRRSAETIRTQCRAIDETLSGFVRGQSSVCLALATFYGAGLTLIGLNSGLLVGISAGLISFVPYVGATAGIVVGLAIAFFQFGAAEPFSIILVAVVFGIGQVAESYVLTPRLVGDRVGLHPVWIIFALLAGGALFGFTGVLLAIPVAAVIGVLIRFGLEQYRESALFSGVDAEVSAAQAPETRTETPQKSSEEHAS